jgi:hypothetical protein
LLPWVASPLLPKNIMPALLLFASLAGSWRPAFVESLRGRVIAKRSTISAKRSPKPQKMIVGMGEFISIRAQSEVGLRTCGALQVVLPQA